MTSKNPKGTYRLQFTRNNRTVHSYLIGVADVASPSKRIEVTILDAWAGVPSYATDVRHCATKDELEDLKNRIVADLASRHEDATTDGLVWIDIPSQNAE